MDFAQLASQPDPPLDRLALAMAAEFGPVDQDEALARLDLLGAALRERLQGVLPTARAQCAVVTQLLGVEEGFAGDRAQYDHPRNSMLDEVLRRRRGLPILLSAVYAEVARRAGVPLHGIGLPGHYVVGHAGADPPLLLDPFDGGAPLAADDVPRTTLRPWTSTETALRMLNNLTASFSRRGDVVSALRAAELRLALPCDEATRELLVRELRAVRARLN